MEAAEHHIQKIQVEREKLKELSRMENFIIREHRQKLRNPRANLSVLSSKNSYAELNRDVSVKGSVSGYLTQVTSPTGKMSVFY
jgi:predicted  nucleic acid-binding Zn-ribbon protein